MSYHMKYQIIGKRGFLMIGFVLIVIVCVGGFGLQQTAVQVSTASKSLPIYSVETSEKQVAIGMNCAWGNEDIPDILDVLDQLEVKITFFLVGDWVSRYPDTVKELSKRGHELGNHSDTHADMTTLDRQGIEAELQGCTDKIETITGIKTDLFRAPSGSYNNQVIEVAREAGYYPIQWDCDSVDWKGATPDQMQKRIDKTLGSGSILLFHNDTDYTAQALPQIIKKMQQDGYELVPVGKLIHKGSYTVDHAGRQSPASGR